MMAPVGLGRSLKGDSFVRRRRWREPAPALRTSSPEPVDNITPDRDKIKREDRLLSQRILTPSDPAAEAGSALGSTDPDDGAKSARSAVFGDPVPGQNFVTVGTRLRAEVEARPPN